MNRLLMKVFLQWKAFWRQHGQEMERFRRYQVEQQQSFLANRRPNP